MLLTIDIGNTNIVLGVFGKKLKGSWRIGTRLRETSDEYGVLLTDLFGTSGIKTTRITGVILSSVVPPLTPTFIEMSQRYFSRDPMVVDTEMETGLDILYEPARDVGADRIVNAVAAYSRYGGPIIIVDFGTATTFCAVSKKGKYLGGAICPGFTISAEALFQQTSRLPRVDLVKPKSVIGKDTASSIQAGLCYGYPGMVDALVHKMKQELGENTRVVATGGQLNQVLPELSSIDEVSPLLTLEGLKILYDNNKNSYKSSLSG